jgi:AraC-like DNA-binding protein
MMIALCARITYDVQFVLRSGYETAIIESLKISQIEMNNGVRPDTYKDLYDRVVEYFEKDKPFLNSRLTINDVVKFVYSNKLYISRAISQYTGRNFCQFVNYYRVMYSVDCFRKNPDLKVAELSEMCGFNSPVTFNLAFHLFMHENPSEWFRKERSRIRKR